ncbi:hypothetical protein PV327_006864 [Microctonus hyperodae]|uniref:Uncharacterized protein n=1 Tax=Microctonus hyperodae TaxID=165561 RepID=A0AA39F5B5_MICHY|nr:hypothetical protein PV327_006864 [Microctonus hyperodae]
MHTSCFVFVVLCVAFAASLDLGPLIRIAQCRSQCVKANDIDGGCEWIENRNETICNQCWKICDPFETQWEVAKYICEGDDYLRSPGYQTACLYRKTRLEEEYLPSSLPAPKSGPIKLGAHDIAIAFFKSRGKWLPTEYFASPRNPVLRQESWILVVLEDGVQSYSWEEWRPTLESLKEGPFVEATLSWHDISDQLIRLRESERKKFNERVRQYYLERYGEKVLREWRNQQDTPISDQVFRRFFFRRFEDELQDDRMKKNLLLQNLARQSVVSSILERTESSYVVSWEPETGGLMGNQVVDTESAQISLLPGTKYLVRIASNEGPGSFPIEIDTRPKFDHVLKQKKNLDNICPLEIIAGVLLALIVITAIICIRLCFCRSPKNVDQADV